MGRARVRPRAAGTSAVAGRALRRLPAERDLVEWIPDGVLVCDVHGRIVLANRQVEQLTGYRRAELIGKRIELLVPENLRAIHIRHRLDYHADHADPRPMSGSQRDFRVRRKDGSEISADIALGPIETSSGQQTVAVIRDITERREMEAALEHRALHDPLTDLPNRTLFFDRLRQSLSNGRREHKHVALAMLDLDGFKNVNDAYGHAVGDELLKELAVRFRAGLRATDTVARIGGDEFAWILPRVAGRDVAERMVRKRLNALQGAFSNRDDLVQVQVSAGVALYPDDGKDVDTLMGHADAAMYSAKREGRGLVFYQSNRRALRR